VGRRRESTLCRVQGSVLAWKGAEEPETECSSLRERLLLGGPLDLDAIRMASSG
jgi:hypothetical protein